MKTAVLLNVLLFVSILQICSQENSYKNIEFGFSLISNPNEDSLIYSFTVDQIKYNGDSCPTAVQIPGFEAIDSHVKLSERYSEQVSYNGVKFCFIKSDESGAAGSSYVDYYYIVRDDNGKIILLTFTLRLANCMNYDDFEYCLKKNEEKEKRPEYFMQTFKFIK